MIEIDKNIFKILNIIYISQFLVKSKFAYFIFIYLLFLLGNIYNI